MAYPKKLNASNKITQERAVEAHAGFVSYVVGKVKKIGIETVLQQYQPCIGPPTEYFWLLKAYKQVLEFAEKVQIANMAKPLLDQSRHTHFTVILDGQNSRQADVKANGRFQTVDK